MLAQGLPWRVPLRTTASTIERRKRRGFRL